MFPILWDLPGLLSVADYTPLRFPRSCGQGGTDPGRLRDCGKIVGVLLSDIGTQEEGERAVQTLRGLGSVLVDTIARMPYCAMQRQLDVSYPKGQRHYWKSVFLDSLTNDVIDVMIETMSDSPSPLNLILLETYGGAVARVTSDSTAFGHRDAT